MNRAHRLAAAVLLLSAPARGQIISAMPGTLPLPIMQGSVTVSQSFPAAAVGSAIVIGNTGAGTLSVTLAGLSASGATVAFSASDNGGSSYYPVAGLGGAANTRTTTAAADGSYTFSVAGRTAIQIAVSSRASGPSRRAIPRVRACGWSAWTAQRQVRCSPRTTPPPWRSRIASR